MACIHGKHHHKPFPSEAAHHATSILELVYMDSCGPLLHKTVEGALYFMLINDDSKTKFGLIFHALKHSLGFKNGFL